MDAPQRSFWKFVARQAVSAEALVRLNHQSMQLSEEDLLRRVRAGDDQAFGEAYDQYSLVLFRYAYRLVGDPVAAEDIMAETFYRWLQAERADRGPREYLMGYLYRTAHNLAMDHWRRRPATLVAASAWNAVQPDDLSETIESATAQARARAALWKLTPDQRQVIVLKYFEALTNAQAGSALGKPISAVKALQHRALAALRRILLDELEVMP